MDSHHVSKISDFSDKLNPMLVKELRQGMRSIGFVGLFISFQALLCIILLMTAYAAQPETAGTKLSGIITFFFFTAAVIFQPFRGLSALEQEIKGNTIDLLSMTRLDAWRITYGKWLSIVAQSALLLTAIIPYLILRYFFGNMQLFSEILLLVSLFILSATLTAGAIALSAIPSILIRRILPILGIVSMVFIIPNLIFGYGGLGVSLSDLTSLNDLESILTYLGILTIFVYATWFFLDFGASMIATSAENRATKRRLISLGYFILLIITFLAIDFDTQGIAVFGSLLCTPVIIASLTEGNDLLPVTTIPFVRKGAFGKIASYFFYPGWASGLIYTLTLYIVLQLVFFSMNLYSFTELATVNIFFSILLFPLSMNALFFKNKEKNIGRYLIFLVSQLIALIAIISIAEASDIEELTYFFFWIPSSMIYIYNENSSGDNHSLTLSYINMIIYSLIPIFLSISAWRRIRETEKNIIEPPTN